MKNTETIQYWMISANSKDYDHFRSFQDNGFIDWKQQQIHFHVGDIVYIYSTVPYKTLSFVTEVTKVGMTKAEAFDDSRYWKNGINKNDKVNSFVRLKLLQTLCLPSLSYEGLIKHGLKQAPQIPSRLEPELVQYIQKCISDDSYLSEDKDDPAEDDMIALMVDDGVRLNEPLEPPEPIDTPKGKKWPRDPWVKAKALEKADFCCEVDKTHRSFISKKTNHNYTEAHHLIPLTAQGDPRFVNVNLDCTANVVSLCSNCHNQLHYGTNPEMILKPLYDQRIDALRKRGIDITFEDLLKFYKS